MHPAVLIGGILTLALVLRLLYLDSQSFWTDEGASISISRQSGPGFLNTITHNEANMTLYYILLRLWLHLGDSEFFIRSLSVVFSSLTVPVVYALGRRLADVRVGLIAALLTAVNAFHIQYAQEARSYSLVVFLVSLASLSFVAGTERPSWNRWIGYIVTSVLAVYAHVFGILVVAAHWGSLMFLPPRKVPWKALLTATLIIGVLVLPLGIVIATNEHGQVNWILRPSLGSIPRVIDALGGAGGSLPESAKRALALPEVGRRLLQLGYLTFLAVALTRAVRSWAAQRASTEAWHYGVMVTWLFVPILLAFGVSQVKPIFQRNYLIVSLPPLALLVAIGLSGLQRREVRLAVLAALVGLASREVYSYYRYATKDDYRAMTSYVLSHADPGDVIVFYPLGQGAFDYYRGRVARSNEHVRRTVLSEYRIPPGAAVSFAQHQFSLDPLQVLRDRSRRVWLVLKDDWIMPSTPIGAVDVASFGNVIQAFLGENHNLADKVTFGGNVRLLLYER